MIDKKRRITKRETSEAASSLARRRWSCLNEQQRREALEPATKARLAKAEAAKKAGESAA